MLVVLVSKTGIFSTDWLIYSVRVAMTHNGFGLGEVAEHKTSIVVQTIEIYVDILNQYENPKILELF